MSLESEVKRVADAVEKLCELFTGAAVLSGQIPVSKDGESMPVQNVEPPPPAKKPRKKKEEKPAVEETPVNEAPTPEENEAVPIPTKEDLRTLAVQVLQKHTAKKGHMLMRKAMEPFNATKLSDVPEENYTEVHAALSELLV